MRKFVILLCAILPVATAAPAQNASTLAERIRQVAARPVFKHSTFGVEIYDLTTRQVLVAMNEDKLFTSGSTTKVITEGTALALLGADYRFHTRVYSTGSVTPDGTLQGDLVLVASGDPNLSGRVEDDGTLDFTSFDHSYAGVLPGNSVIGDPLQVLNELAIGVYRSGILRIHGRVLVDASLFPSDHVEPATHTTVSPVVLNDNVIDVKARSGSSAGDPVSVEVAPDLPYLKVINKVITGSPESEPDLRFTSDIAEEDGSHTVVLEGSVPAGRQKAQAAYKVKDPVLYATEGFREALRWAHIELDSPEESADAIPPVDLKESNLVAEHISPPFKEEVRLTLKVSQNLHAATTPYLLGAIVGHSSSDAFQTGLGLEKQFLTEAGLDVESVSQLDGEGGVGSAFSPDFMVRYLAYMSRQPYGHLLFDSLPVLGRDGTLVEMLPDSPAAGHVHAKTGSYVVYNALDRGVMLLGKGLVGYVDAKNGHRLIFAAYVNLVPLHNMDEVAGVGQMLTEIAGLVYQYAPSSAPVAQKTVKPAARTKGKRRVH